MRGPVVARLSLRALPLLLLLSAFPCFGDVAPAVDSFSPQGTARKARQATARFTEPMVPFGDPRVSDPFEVSCTEGARGRGRWVDGRTWSYDFDGDLPAGIWCTFTLKPGLRSLSGAPVGGRRDFSFTTGGPSILQSIPGDGDDRIDENQAFLLLLDAPPDETSVLAHAFFSAGGVREAIGVRLIKGKEREALIEAGPAAGWRRRDPAADRRIVALMPAQAFPSGAKVALWWGAGVRTAGGVATEESRKLGFRARPAFNVLLRCDRERKGGDCLPILPIRLEFTAPVERSLASKIVLRAADGTARRPVLPDDLPGDAFVSGAVFEGPFPGKSRFRVEIPPDLADDAGRAPANRGKFPLDVATAAFPPLAKFPAPFGIVESRGDAALPLTVRNIEGRAKGWLYRLPEGGEGRVVDWLRRIDRAQGSWERRSFPLLADLPEAKEFAVPKPGGEQAFEVVGVPLPGPGFYVVEVASERLGRSLLDGGRMYVSAAALVTNLSAHLKRGRESSLVWVTSLDRGEPVEGADVAVRDPSGKVLWEGKTDGDGVARIGGPLSDPGMPEGCAPHCGLYATARKGDDMTFVLAEWQDGIEPYRFQLPTAYRADPAIAHTVFDRTLFQAGETVRMKHFLRRHGMDGLFNVPGERLPASVLLRHEGSGQRFEMPLAWAPDGSAVSEWAIPREAKLGVYGVFLREKAKPAKGSRDAADGAAEADEEYAQMGRGDRYAGSFRVEEYRVPLMKASVEPAGPPRVNAREAELDLAVSYLSGGGAGGAAVRLRTAVSPRAVSFPGYGDYVFANGRVVEGISRRGGDEGDAWEEEGPPEEEGAPGKASIRTRELLLDARGTLRTKVTGIARSLEARELSAELEYADPDGEIQAVSTRVPLWPSRVLLGIKPDSWAASKEAFRFHVAALDLAGAPVAGVPVAVDLFQRKSYTHRKRLLGGVYAYEHAMEIVKVGALCRGTTDGHGLLTCETASPVSGNVILQASAADAEGNASFANRDVWVAGKDDWWFDVSSQDRIDLLPEKKRYEPGETAVFQVRMPFREATALVTVEREGIADVYVRKLSGKSPVVELPVRPYYAPNVYVSVLCVRGRVADAPPTATVDLGKPAFRLGIAGIDVGWKVHEMKVEVKPERDVYRVREKAKVKVRAARADGGPLPKGAEAVVAAVDEGILELAPNASWNLLEAMMRRRSYEVSTATAQMQVVGKRHFGLKAQKQGGGGALRARGAGMQAARERFETTLFWNARVPLDANGEATVEIPLNDSLTSFRIVAVASGGAEFFGTGEASVRSTRDVMVLSGLPPMAREGDAFRAGFTVRNATDRAMKVRVDAATEPRTGKGPLPPVPLSLAPGEAKEAAWDVRVPAGAGTLLWDVSVASEDGASSDRIRVTQTVAPAVPVRAFQATLARLEAPLSMKAALPAGALPGRGGVSVSMRARLSGGMDGVIHAMREYPYTCLEQRVSRAVALRDPALWKGIVSNLPAWLDRDGMAKYFPSMPEGSDVLTTYILAIAQEAGWEIPEDARNRMAGALERFVEGRVVRNGPLPAADLSFRKMAALEALSRYGRGKASHVDAIAPDPHHWPTSGVIDWLGVLSRIGKIPGQERRIAEAEGILRSRMNLQGTTMGFSTERTDGLWWLMVSGDVNAVRAILALQGRPGWKEDVPRMVRGALGRQRRGAWGTTVANAWGTLAMEKFSREYEPEGVAGTTSAALGAGRGAVDWGKTPKGDDLVLPWPKGTGTLELAHRGTGRPWATVRSMAAVPLKTPFSSGFTAVKTMTPVQRKAAGRWSRGDVVRVRLALEAQADMTWVVVSDPVPAGATILGTGLGRDSRLLSKGEKREGTARPAFTERAREAFRAYYAFVPKGKWAVEYTLRINNPGTFLLPPTRVEALYSPEMFGELPNAAFVVAR
jgi:uncharacterized protein YfaS (alpha-2-macroglobulin family)